MQEPAAFKNASITDEWQLAKYSKELCTQTLKQFQLCDHSARCTINVKAKVAGVKDWVLF
jgi:hypothetical protein